VSKAAAQIKVEGVKVTTDIDSVFKVQAGFRGTNSRPNGIGLGVVGGIEDGKLTLTIPGTFNDSQLFDARSYDLGSDVTGLKLGRLEIRTSRADVLLHYDENGEDIIIYYANKDGVVDFGLGGRVALKAGWNFVQGFEGEVYDGAPVHYSLAEVYNIGFTWILRE